MPQRSILKVLSVLSSSVALVLACGAYCIALAPIWSPILQPLFVPFLRLRIVPCSLLTVFWNGDLLHLFVLFRFNDDLLIIFSLSFKRQGTLNRKKQIFTKRENGSQTFSSLSIIAYCGHLSYNFYNIAIRIVFVWSSVN